MASATLMLETDVPPGYEDKHVFRVDADPFDASPFAGPAGRNWDAFVVHDPTHATYEWRTGADRAREYARDLVARGCPKREVRQAFATDDYLARMDEQTIDDARGDDELTFADAHARRVWILEGLAQGRWDPAESDEGHSYYDVESDQHLGDAADALELPAWAERDEWDDGGPGSGYTARFIVLEAGRTLADLATWLDERVRTGDRKRAGGSS